VITEIIRIGNSRGIRIPKPLLEECGLTDVVELKVEGHTLRISRGRKVREGWEEAFQRAEDCGEDELLLEGAGTESFDAEEWQW
jgi:antitoxin MazE